MLHGESIWQQLLYLGLLTCQTSKLVSEDALKIGFEVTFDGKKEKKKTRQILLTILYLI